MEILKDFLKAKLTQQKEEYEKELKIADDRWKANEDYKDRYLDAYVSGNLEGQDRMSKEIKKGVERIELECETVVCECGSKLRDWDLTNLV